MYKNPRMWVIKNKSDGRPGFMKSVLLKKKERKEEGGTPHHKMCYTFYFSDNR